MLPSYIDVLLLEVCIRIWSRIDYSCLDNYLGPFVGFGGLRERLLGVGAIVASVAAMVSIVFWHCIEKKLIIEK